MDLLGFLVGPALYLLVVIGFSHLKIRTSVSELVVVPELVPEEISLEVAAWDQMFDELAGQSTFAVPSFARWKRARLAALPPELRVTPAAVSTCWRRTNDAWLNVWLPALWLPALCVTLAAVPHYTNVMEALAVLRSRIEIFDVIVSGVHPTAPGQTVPDNVIESIYSTGHRQSLQRVSTALVSNGYVTLPATDFPRVYRRIKAICSGRSPGCAIVRDPTDAIGLEVETRVRAGRARVHFIQTTFDQPLNLKLWLLRRDGALLDEVGIEP
jgi:hypothetical protein